MGGVLIGYRWKEMLTDDFGVSVDRAEAIGRALFEDPIWRDFDAGIIRAEDVLEHYTRLYPDDAAVIQRSFHEGELMSVPRERVWEKVTQLKACGYNTYVLSNYSKYLFDKHTRDVPFETMIDGTVVSYQVKVIKPDPAIYRYMLDKYGLVPEETLFYDDLEINVRAAQELGINAIRITSEEMLLDELSKLV